MHLGMCERTSLSKRVRELLREPLGSRRRSLALEAVEAEPTDGAGLTAREYELRDWGLTLGIALGLRFAEDPEDREQAATEALSAARTVFREWNGPVRARSIVSPHADALLALWDGAFAEHSRLSGAMPEEGFGAFSEAMADLQSAVGTPAPSERAKAMLGARLAQEQHEQAEMIAEAERGGENVRAGSTAVDAGAQGV